MKKKTSSILAACLSLGALVGISAGLYFGNSSVRSYMDGLLSSVGSVDSSGTPAASSSADGTLGLQAPNSQLRHVRNADGTYTQSAITVTATVNADASDKTLAWSFAWVTSSSLTVGDYVSITPAATSAGGTCTVTAKKAFSGLIRLTATTVDKATAYLDFSYYNEVASIDVTPITGGATSQYPDISNAYNSYSAVWIPLTKTDSGYWYKRAADDNNSYVRYFEVLVDFYAADKTITPTFYNDLVDSNIENYQSSLALEGFKAWVKTSCPSLFGNTNVDFKLCGVSTTGELSAAGALTIHFDIIGDSTVLPASGVSPNFTVDGISSSFSYNIYQYIAATSVSASGDTVL